MIGPCYQKQPHSSNQNSLFISKTLSEYSWKLKCLPAQKIILHKWCSIIYSSSIHCALCFYKKIYFLNKTPFGSINFITFPKVTMLSTGRSDLLSLAIEYTRSCLWSKACRVYSLIHIKSSHDCRVVLTAWLTAAPVRFSHKSRIVGTWPQERKATNGIYSLSILVDLQGLIVYCTLLK